MSIEQRDDDDNEPAITKDEKPFMVMRLPLTSNTCNDGTRVADSRNHYYINNEHYVIIGKSREVVCVL